MWNCRGLDRVVTERQCYDISLYKHPTRAQDTQHAEACAAYGVSSETLRPGQREFEYNQMFICSGHKLGQGTKSGDSVCDSAKFCSPIRKQERKKRSVLISNTTDPTV